MNPSAPTHLVIGTIVGARGIHGELKVNIETDRPERYYDLENVLVGPNKTLHQVKKARLFKGQALLQLAGVNSPELAERLRGQRIYVAIEDAYPLEDDAFYVFELEGLKVVTEEGDNLGKLVEVLSTGANDVYVVRGPRGEVLLPAIHDVILEVDTEQGVMKVRPLPGLI